MIIDRHNYEEYFLLYVDRELTDDQRRQVDNFLSRHPDLQQELEILKQTIAIPSLVVFDDKASLMREEKERRRIPVYWWRVAAALVVLLAGAWFYRIWFDSGNALSVSDPGQLGVISKPKAQTSVEKSARASVAFAKAADANPGSVSAGVKKSPGASPTAGKRAVDKQEQVVTPEKNVVGADPSPVETNIPDAVRPEAAAPSVSAEAIHLPEAFHASPPIVADSSPVRQILTANRSVRDSRPPSTDSTNTGESILVFDNKSKAVSGFLKRLTASDPPKDASAASGRRKISVSVFQFNIKK